MTMDMIYTPNFWFGFIAGSAAACLLILAWSSDMGIPRRKEDID